MKKNCWIRRMEILHGRHSTDDLLPVLLRDRVVNDRAKSTEHWLRARRGHLFL